MSSSPPPPPAGAAPATLTPTQSDQLNVEIKVAEIYAILQGVPSHTQTLMLELWREKHVGFLTTGLRRVGASFQVLDANRPWMCYWILHSLKLLGEDLEPEVEDGVVDFLARCQGKDGGYGGGPGQLPHLATTYAAVNSLLTVGTEKAYTSINRDKIYTFLLQMKDSSGGFRMHDGGEIDVRASYTAISVASCLKILDDKLVDNVGNYILRCQTYEGGIAGEPGSEAHGGYTFCGLSAMILINEADKLDLLSLSDWVAFRQGVECGFQGRVNKLVDGCYSFWQGGVLALLQRIMPTVDRQSEKLYCRGQEQSSTDTFFASADLPGGTSVVDKNSCETDKIFCAKSEGSYSDVGIAFLSKQNECGPLFNNIALQQYILLCSQVLEGGFKDKPGKYRDHYHTCYCLSGLSVCQYSSSKDGEAAPLPNAVLGPYSNLLEPIHPLFNVVLDSYMKAHEFFSTH